MVKLHFDCAALVRIFSWFYCICGTQS